MKFDVAIIGGGLVGCATAYRLIDHPSVRRLVLLEKESAVAGHQSGRNSGVIHSGIYYRPGSHKAETCRLGRKQLIEFCTQEGIPFEICGKVIVATSDSELTVLRSILERGIANGINCGPIDTDRLQEIEPHATGIAALNVPDAGITDFKLVCDRLADKCLEHGFEIRTDTTVLDLEHRPNTVAVQTSDGDYEADVVVNCAGLHSDRIARMSGVDPALKILPFRGLFFELRPESRYLCNSLIYPVPDPSYPFLGVHLTKTIDGRVECGPNAVLATGREGYSFFSGSIRDTAEMMAYPGFHRLSMKHWQKGLAEMGRTAFKRSFLNEARRLVPALTDNDLIPSRSGIRAQAVDRRGEMVDDFVILESGSVVNVCNAPSPAATACLRIGQLITERVEELLT